RIAGGNVLTGGVADVSAVGPPLTLGRTAPAAVPRTPTLTERLAQETPVRGLARRIPVTPPAPPTSGALAGLLGLQARRPDQDSKLKNAPIVTRLASRSVGTGGASQKASDAGRDDPLSPRANPQRGRQQIAESPIPPVEEKTAREKKVEGERERLEKNKDPKFVVRMEENRVWAIQNNRQVVFNIRDNPRARGDAPPFRRHSEGFKAVQKHDAIVEREARRFGVDPDLVRAIMYIENADGSRFGMDVGAQRLGFASTLLPMNINPETWDGIGGVGKEDFGKPDQNIRASVALIKAIQDRVPNPTPAKIGSIWQFTGREQVSDNGAKIEEALKQKLWTVKPLSGAALRRQRRMERRGVANPQR
ncbi:MAG: hypothetical protein MJE12_02885, partial [Alphaproteobacteria bacterium]|nr:hypothetical protein [Alphaproteobacteria bacterium]